MRALGPSRNRAWLVRNFWLITLLVNVILVFVVLMLLALLLTR